MSSGQQDDSNEAGGIDDYFTSSPPHIDIDLGQPTNDNNNTFLASNENGLQGGNLEQQQSIGNVPPPAATKNSFPENTTAASTTSTSPFTSQTAQQTPFYEKLHNDWYHCNSPQQVLQKYNHENLPQSLLILDPQNWPKEVAALIPTKSNYPSEPPAHVQNFHILLYCWLIAHNAPQNNFPDRHPSLNNIFLNLQLLYREVLKRYGFQNVCQNEGPYGWLGVFHQLPNYAREISNYDAQLKHFYTLYLVEFEKRNAYFDEKYMQLLFSPVPHYNLDPLVIELKYYLDDKSMRDISIQPSNTSASSFEVKRNTIVLGIGLNLQGKEDDLKKLPQTTGIRAGDVVYSRAKKSLVLCYTPHENDSIYQEFEPYFLVGRVRERVWDVLDELRTQYLKPLVAGEARVDLKAIETPDNNIDDSAPDYIRNKPTPTFIKWGEEPNQKNSGASDRSLDGNSATTNNSSPHPQMGSTQQASGNVGSSHISQSTTGAAPTPALPSSASSNAAMTSPPPSLPPSVGKSRKRSETDSDAQPSRKKRKIDSSSAAWPATMTSDDQDFVPPVPALPPSARDSTQNTVNNILPEANFANTGTITSTEAVALNNGSETLYGTTSAMAQAQAAAAVSDAASAAPALNNTVSTQTNVSFGCTQPICSIRYKFSGGSDDEFRYIPYKLNNQNNVEIIDRKKLLEILREDNIPVDYLREVRYFFQGPNSEVSGWMLVNDEFSYHVPQMSEMRTAPFLNLKLSFHKIE